MGGEISREKVAWLGCERGLKGGRVGLCGLGSVLGGSRTKNHAWGEALDSGWKGGIGPWWDKHPKVGPKGVGSGGGLLKVWLRGVGGKCWFCRGNTKNENKK